MNTAAKLLTFVFLLSAATSFAITALARRKMVINFWDVKSGTYIIKVKKNNRIEEIQSVKKWPGFVGLG